MPDFPRYNSERALTTQQPRALRNDADIQDRAGDITKRTTGAIETAQQGMVQWQGHVDKVQQDTGLYNYKVGMQQISNDAVLDTDITAESKYQKRVQDLRKEVLKSVGSEYVKNNMAAELNYMETVGAIGIQGEFRKKTVLHGQAVAQSNLDLLAQSPGNELAIEKATTDAMKSGYWDEPVAYAKKKKALSDMRQNWFLNDTAENLIETEKKLNSNEYGFDNSELYMAKRRFKYESERQIASNQNDLLKSYVNNEGVKEDQVKSLMNQGKINSTFAQAMITKINSFAPDELSQDQEYVAFQNRGADILAKGNNASMAEISKYMTDAMMAHKSNILDKSDVQRIIKNFDPLMQTKLGQKAEEILNTTNPKTWLQKLSVWSDEYSEKKPEIKARMYRRLMDAVANGKDPDEALKTIIDDEFTVKLSDGLTKPDRQYAVNPDSKQREAYSDDGGLTWMNIKTGKEMK